MFIEFFLGRSRIELTEDGLSYRGCVPDLPQIHVTGATPEQCRAKLAGAMTVLLALEACGGRPGESGVERDDLETWRRSRATSVPTQSSDLRRTTQDVYNDSHSEPEFTDIIYEKKDLVARVTINRPSVYNAYTDQTVREMAAAFRDAASDNSIAVLVLTGAGNRAFSAGGDVQQHVDEHLGNPDAFREWINALIDAHTALRQLGKPSIARINGMVAGGGNDWNIACDLAIAADHAKFVQIEPKVGLLSATSAAHWLPLIVGERRARELFLTGEPISANKALLWGLVNDVVSYKQLDKTVDTLCQKLIDRFPESTRLAREQLSFWKDLAWNSMIKEASDHLAAHFAGEEASEGLRALAEKREVDYRGFRVNAQAVRKPEPPEPREVAAVGALNIRSGSRSCYSCGAQEIPVAFDYCGLCGTRVL
ncbi:MAG TPA: enoyl-CoA hydratase-related protein [Blastocatellia bacterium]|nr:enoyl-CoA hydratase-related protein [Blastocatellia bacterium]